LDEVSNFILRKGGGVVKRNCIIEIFINYGIICLDIVILNITDPMMSRKIRVGLAVVITAVTFVVTFNAHILVAADMLRAYVAERLI
jgi:hypothetical protein